MSYSFSVTAATKEEAKAAVTRYFDENVVSVQLIHARDRDAVIANANSVIDLLADDDTKNITVSCNGYVRGNWNANVDVNTRPFSTTSISATASHTARD